MPLISTEQNYKMPSPGYSASGTDEFAEADAIFRGSTIVAGKQVDDFAKALDQHTVLRGSPAEKRAQIFKLVDHYYDYSCKRAETLRAQAKNARRSSARGLFSGTPVGGPRGSVIDIDEGDSRSALATRTVEEEIQDVEEEAQTWDLLRRILPLRYRDSHHAANTRQSIEDESAPRSRSEFWEEFVVADSTAKERKVVLEWLQNTASRGPPIDEVVKELQQNADRGDILSHSWLHTRSKIKLQKSVNAHQGALDPKNPALADSHLSSNTLITQLDPDAMTRQGRKLEPQDEYFERAIWLGCFEMLRRGYSMSEIRDWCAERTESWRAASISALELSSPQDEDVAGFVPIFAILWRRMCYAAARDGGHGDYERAVYGLLSGDITSVEKVAKTWDDFLFLHYNALLRTQFDNFLIKQSGTEGLTTAQAFPSFNAVQHHGDPVSLGRRFISTLESLEKTKLEALSPAKALQGAIVANDLDRFLYNQGAVIAKDANVKTPSKLIPNVGSHVLDDVFKSRKYVKLRDYDAVRVLAHLFIIITSLDQLMGADDSSQGSKFGNRFNLQEQILAGYISNLRISEHIDLVPLYSSKLQGDRKYTSLCRNLIEITGQVARENQLAVMKKLGLDLNMFALTGPRVFLADVNEDDVPCEAKGSFKVLKPGAPTLQYGRAMQQDFFGEDAEFVDEEDEHIIRAIEWLMLVPDLFDETVDYAIRAHMYFLKRMRLRAARSLMNRVPLKGIVSLKTNFPMPLELEDMNMWMEEFLSQIQDSVQNGEGRRRSQHYNVKVLWQLESLVKSLDSIETIASMAHLVREEPLNTSKELWKEALSEIRVLKSSMTPILNGWLAEIYSPDVPQIIQDLREAYIPETVLAYISSLHFVGNFASRDHLMECMDLAALIADREGDMTAEFTKAGRLKELVEAFASASKALAVSTSERGGRDSIAKKSRESGWSRELWSVKP